MKVTLPMLALAGFATTAAAQQVEVPTFAGPVDVATSPQRVVAFDLAAIDSLDALGVTVDGVPDFTPPAYLADAMDGITTVGTLFEPDFEALAVMAPDLIIAGGRSQTQVDALSRVAPTLDMTISETVIDDAIARVIAYGQIFDKAEAAATLTADLDAAVTQAQSVAAGKGRALILLTNGGKISAYGEGSRFGWIHSALNIPQAYPDLTSGSHGEAVSFEFVAEVDPDWIFVVDRGAAIGQEGEAAAVTLDNPLVAETKAAQQGQIVYLDSAPLYLAGGGIQSLMGTIADITAALQGDTDS
ncbi:siderophore ABC transporter substrate-binding protein [Loktanella sp. TSTF-M6]|uniref:Siderophore ABC transporter substrate-binding protein n=1 Tax=Loktanella gaetbuli TaxID=2881335 RepID=A0ABS8BSD6_9RHOB|nr:siderophore ABC transporter substrate-binding protein [Loktanella gaetbuli]MCB5198626.1 siderophore ABC transporter substrate-binding protein [Loktanella gaetbuli]